MKVRNVSSHPCRFRILPLTKYSPFRIQWKDCAGHSKHLAAGNFIEVTVTFSCTINEDYCEQLLIRVENCEDLNIPIKAILKPPFLKGSKMRFINFQFLY